MHAMNGKMRKNRSDTGQTFKKRWLRPALAVLNFFQVNRCPDEKTTMGHIKTVKNMTMGRKRLDRFLRRSATGGISLQSENFKNLSRSKIAVVNRRAIARRNPGPGGSAVRSPEWALHVFPGPHGFSVNQPGNL